MCCMLLSPSLLSSLCSLLLFVSVLVESSSRAQPVATQEFGGYGVPESRVSAGDVIMRY